MQKNGSGIFEEESTQFIFIKFILRHKKVIYMSLKANIIFVE